jgi:Flp pilus assembly protein TadG
MLRHLWIEQTGAQSLEFVALLPLIILVLLTMLQIAFVGYAVVVAETSAREAALAASRDSTLSKSTADKAARQAAGGLSVTVKSLNCHSGDVSVELEAQVPNVLFDSSIAISRQVTIPRQDGGCP